MEVEEVKQAEVHHQTSPRWSASRSTASVTEHPSTISRVCLRNTAELGMFIYPRITEPKRAEVLDLFVFTARTMLKMLLMLWTAESMMEEN